MKASILHIGVLDKSGQVHAVSFTTGVNVVTGRSSTGKSALIEIFDYCFGSSDYTIPVGVITDHAALYFVVLRLGESALVLAREPKSKRASVTEELDLSVVDDVMRLNRNYFDNVDFDPLADFLKKLRGYFGIAITDVDTDAEVAKQKRQRSSSPSVRSLTSFMLQHQNLVANKHAIFYRFDENKKRDQVLEHLKIFLGFVDQSYFFKMQELADLNREVRKLEGMVPRREDFKGRALSRLEEAFIKYRSITGDDLELTAEKAWAGPKGALKQFRKVRINLLPESDKHAKIRQEAIDSRSRILADLRKEQRNLEDVRSSIQHAKDYRKTVASQKVPSQATLTASECPFCHSHNSPVEQKANELSVAIGWLNSEIGRSAYRLDSFEEHERIVTERITGYKQQISDYDQRIEAIDKQLLGLQDLKDQQELALLAKLRIEAILEDLGDKTKDDLEKKLEELNGKVTKLKRQLKEEYDVESKLGIAEGKILGYMKELGTSFDFEASYLPINLHFSLETFDLCHVSKDDGQVYLRSMGSGANWLSCHLTLFLALHRYFCELGDECAIPSIMFFDQPSQVYFPAVVDYREEFSKADLAVEGENRKRPVDEDLEAVSGMFSAMVKFCSDTKEATGIEPQIIVTDHADNLELDGDDVSFEDLVAGRRWRKKGDGFIKVEATEE
jgi:hypothetical protein